MLTRFGIVVTLMTIGAWSAGPSSAQEKKGEPTFTLAQLAERTLHRRAVESAIWGMPAVNYERMLQAAKDNGAKLNQVVYWSKPVNSKNQTLTPNQIGRASCRERV